MAFLVTEEWHNGYRCTCCINEWESSQWFDTLEEALLQYPVVPFKKENDEVDLNGLIGLSILDGSTKEKVASLNVSWPPFGRGHRYSYTHYYGYKPDSDYFSIVTDGAGNVLDKSWEDCVKEIENKKHNEEISKYKNELNKVIKSLSALGIHVKVEFENAVQPNDTSKTS